MTTLTEEQVRRWTEASAWTLDRNPQNAEAAWAKALGQDSLRLREELGDLARCEVRERTASNMVDEANALQQALDAMSSHLIGVSADRDRLKARLAAVEALPDVLRREANDTEGGPSYMAIYATFRRAADIVEEVLAAVLSIEEEKP